MIEVVKGGLIIDLGVRGFLPASLVDIRRVQNLDEFLGTKIECKVIELNRSRNNVVLSRRAVLEEERKEVRQQILDRLQPGMVVEGAISNIVDFGAFVDLDGIDGLIHISELSWSHVNHPSEILSIGDVVPVKVLDIDRDRQRISLGLKQTQEDPWQRVIDTYRIGDELEGKVTKVVTFGAFVEIMDGVEGLVHISELAHHHVENPREIVEPGQDVRVKILEIDSERRRLSLSVKRVEEQLAHIKSAAEAGAAAAEANAGEIGDVPDLGLSEDVFAGPSIGGLDALRNLPGRAGAGRGAEPAEASRRPRRSCPRQAGGRGGAARGGAGRRGGAARGRAGPGCRRSGARAGGSGDRAGRDVPEAEPAGLPTLPRGARRSSERGRRAPGPVDGRGPVRGAHRRSWRGQVRGAARARRAGRGHPLHRRGRPRAARERRAARHRRRAARPGGRADGALDRSLIAERVFGDDEARGWLEGELWPRVGQRVAEWKQEVEAARARRRPRRWSRCRSCSSPGWRPVFDATIAVVADEALRQERAGARGHAAVAERAGRQLSQDEKAQRADFVVRNDGTLEELRETLSRVLATLEPVP